MGGVLGWLSQLSDWLSISAQVMVSQFVRWSPALGFSLFLSLSHKINKYLKNKGSWVTLLFLMYVMGCMVVSLRRKENAEGKAEEKLSFVSYKLRRNYPFISCNYRSEDEEKAEG